jgi:hypothetical protein
VREIGRFMDLSGTGVLIPEALVGSSSLINLARPQASRWCQRSIGLAQRETFFVRGEAADDNGRKMPVGFTTDRRFLWELVAFPPRSPAANSAAIIKE